MAAEQFSDQLILAPWALSQLGVESWDKLSEMLRVPELEGWADDGGSKFVQQLIIRLPGTGAHRTVTNAQLREYDENIVRHWKAITQKRNLYGPTLYPLYFQYLALLLTEIYLDRFFHDSDALRANLNTALVPPVSYSAKKKGKKLAEKQDLYSIEDLNKIAFWMATGSGKTLLMHCHIRQYLHYSGKAGKKHELNRIILLTPNEGLSRQHLDEFALSGIDAELYEKDGASLFTGRAVDVIDIHKLRETSGEKTVAVDTFEANNLVLVDEGHRGAGGEEWMDKRARLCADGFSFEYSATFGQAIKAASGTKQRELALTYQKCILFDYSYKFFYNDGYGKDFNILNLAEEKEEETRPLYLTACLLAFYQQCRRHTDGGAALKPYLLEAPLMVFVGGSVTGQRQSQEDTDLVLILKFLAEFISNRKDSEKRLKRLLQHKDGLLIGTERVFEGFFPLVEDMWIEKSESELFQDIMRVVFNATAGQLHIVRLQGSEGEIGLRIGENEWFGVVNVGDSKGLCDLCAERKAEHDHYVVEDMQFSGSLFEDIKRDGSPIRILAGAKKFTEGWSSWRVSAMGLMNIGKKEGSEIIQLFGRGVRLKGYGFKLKRSKALDPLDFFGEDFPEKHPKYIELLETLNIFGVRSNYMKQFQEYLEEEGLDDDERREEILIPTIQLPEFKKGKLDLKVIRPSLDMPDFKKERRLRLSSLEGKLNSKVVADWYPRLQKESSRKPAEADFEAPAAVRLKTEHRAFLDWPQIWFDLERYKAEKAYYNVVFNADDLRALLDQHWWYDVYIPPGHMEFRFDRRALWQEIATVLLKSYLDRFYQFQKSVFEGPYLEYQRLQPGDSELISEYRILVKKSEKKLIELLRKLSDRMKNGEFEQFEHKNLLLFETSFHLYKPLVHLAHAGGDALIKIMPTHLNPGEKQFVLDLEEYCKKEAKGVLAYTDLYLLRNHSSDKAISFFTQSGFRPDFVLWLLNGDMQVIVFLDPKGLVHLSGEFRNDKVQFARVVKEWEQGKLKRDDIRLESFIISQTSRSKLNWGSPTDSKKPASAADYHEHHILLAIDEPDVYIERLITSVLSEPAKI